MKKASYSIYLIAIYNSNAYTPQTFYWRVIINFKCKETEKIWAGEFSRKLPTSIQETALTRLRILNSAVRLENLTVPPGNKLEALKGDRKGQHSIRINRQWRICFSWIDGNAHGVEITDYH